MKLTTRFACAAGFCGLMGSQNAIADNQGFVDNWLAPSSQRIKNTSGDGGLSIDTQWVSKLSDRLNRPDRLIFRDEIVSTLATTDIGSSLMAFAASYSENEKSAAMGVDFGRLSFYANVGNGESYARNVNNYSGMDPYAYHGGNFSEFSYTGAGLGLDIGQGRLQFGQIAVSADRLETRISSYVDYSNNLIYARYTHIERGEESVGYGIDAGLHFGRIDVAYQELATRSDVSTRRIRFNWNQSLRDRLWLEFSVHKNALAREYTDTTVMLSWQRSLGGHQLVRYATESENPGQGDQVETARRTGLNRGLLIGGGVAAAALIASSGSKSQDTAERVIVTIDAQHDAARTVLDVFNPESVAINREYGGYIYQAADGSHAWTEPEIGEAASISLPAPIFAIPAGTTLRATYHTHAAFDPQFDNENFSPTDLEGDSRLNIDGYLGTPAGAFKYHDVATGDVSTLGRINN
ncbi:MAG: DUF4329 domain-containing protein [Proteobacteria bacterium]|jgi:hypothetical protein|nr:DUF4329 domain-containing protein [Pseudomonadota bacterium]